MKSPENMTKQELQDEINSIEQSRQIVAYGVKDIVYLDTLYLEADRRNYTISANFELIDNDDIEGNDQKQKPTHPKREVELYD